MLKSKPTEYFGGLEGYKRKLATLLHNFFSFAEIADLAMFAHAGGKISLRVTYIHNYIS